ncbi:MAG: Gfo/Idh/MocA family oxidoreductase [Oscillibacter sp.]|nr:Gfo/Idh/MocA family oxidoreductase [Oscillibacter sp.]
MRKHDCKEVVVGTVGAGFAAGHHGDGYLHVCTVPVRLKTVADSDLKKAEHIRDTYGYEQATADWQELLADSEIDVIDILTPPYLHKDMILRSLAAGKHVICEKPLTGYFSGDGNTPKREMYAQVVRDLEEIRAAAQRSGKRVMYAENYIYATPVQRAARLIRAKGSKLLFMKGEESTPGSMSAGAGRWSTIGGGPLQRIGCHPLAGILYLKEVEAQARGEHITVTSVLADPGVTTGSLRKGEGQYLAAHPEDVEDFGTLTVTFSDGTKCLMIATDVVLGGTKNYIEVYGHDGALVCNLTPTDLLSTYFCDERGIEDEPLAEMQKSKLGWTKAFVSDEIIRGYMDELTDFMESVALDREPLSTLDLAIRVTRLLYAAYCSAEEGRRVYLDEA